VNLIFKGPVLCKLLRYFQFRQRIWNYDEWLYPPSLLSWAFLSCFVFQLHTFLSPRMHTFRSSWCMPFFKIYPFHISFLWTLPNRSLFWYGLVVGDSDSIILESASSWPAQHRHAIRVFFCALSLGASVRWMVNAFRAVQAVPYMSHRCESAHALKCMNLYLNSLMFSDVSTAFLQINRIPCYATYKLKSMLSWSCQIRELTAAARLTVCFPGPLNRYNFRWHFCSSLHHNSGRCGFSLKPILYVIHLVDKSTST